MFMYIFAANPRTGFPSTLKSAGEAKKLVLSFLDKNSYYYFK